MDVKKLALLVGALVIAVITAVMAKNMFTGAGSQQADGASVADQGVRLSTRLVASRSVTERIVGIRKLSGRCRQLP